MKTVYIVMQGDCSWKVVDEETYLHPPDSMINNKASIGDGLTEILMSNIHWHEMVALYELSAGSTRTARRAGAASRAAPFCCPHPPATRMDPRRTARRILASLPRCEGCGSADCPAAQGAPATCTGMPPGRELVRNPRGVPEVSYWPGSGRKHRTDPDAPTAR